MVIDSSQGLDIKEPSWCLNLRYRILHELADFDNVGSGTGRASLEDACKLAAIHGFAEPSSYNMCEQGLLSLEWCSSHGAVMLVFSGDGIACSSARSADEFYSTMTDFSVDKGMPGQCLDDMEKILSALDDQGWTGRHS